MHTASSQKTANLRIHVEVTCQWGLHFSGLLLLRGNVACSPEMQAKLTFVRLTRKETLLVVTLFRQKKWATRWRKCHTKIRVITPKWSSTNRCRVQTDVQVARLLRHWVLLRDGRRKCLEKPGLWSQAESALALVYSCVLPTSSLKQRRSPTSFPFSDPLDPWSLQSLPPYPCKPLQSSSSCKG